MLPNTFAFSFAGPGDGDPQHTVSQRPGELGPTLLLDETVDHEELQELRPYEAWLEVPARRKWGLGVPSCCDERIINPGSWICQFRSYHVKRIGTLRFTLLHENKRTCSAGDGNSSFLSLELPALGAGSLYDADLQVIRQVRRRDQAHAFLQGVTTRCKNHICPVLFRVTACISWQAVSASSRSYNPKA